MTHVRLVLAVVLLLSSIAVACPVCDTSTGQQVRDGIVDADFWPNLLAISLPFILSVGFVFFIRGRQAGHSHDA